ncbi:amino acid ABC transporter ATP-binding/permease protein [Paenibacillus arenosi]|uniref:Amino acid ABC transporter ATP-binding/permease protein n=1 Tax=Paenibacillus arenosi TaxID=2774142 RepID=A0ABR9AWM2_9BACL|nr:amino acid ABC transporter ATP-binding/permease protein [Paenibacillus arenosi]MBD8498049.1 amino acid ABC transporter ATP-binding/permease protein [Paenibacillus arenosi]
MKREDWIRPYFSTHTWRFALIVFLGLLTALCASALMFTSGYLISKSSLRPENILMVYVPVVLVRTFGISRSVVHYVERLVGHDTILRILSHMRVRLYRLLEPQALFIRSRFRTGDILGMLADDIEYLQNIFMRTIFPSIVALAAYVVVIAALGWFDPAFALLMAFYIALLIFVLPALSLYVNKARNRQLKQKRNQLYQKLTDAVLGMGDWVISGRQATFVNDYEREEAEVARIERSLSNWSKWRTFAAQGVVGAVVISMIYWAAQMFAAQAIDATLIAAFVLVVFPMMEAFLPVSDAIDKLPQYTDSLDRMAKVDQGEGEGESRNKSKHEGESEGARKNSITSGEQQASESAERAADGRAGKSRGNYDSCGNSDNHENHENHENRDNHDKCDKRSHSDSSSLITEKLVQAARQSAHIRIEHASYRYEQGSEMAVEELSLDIPQGKKIAVIGRSGAGKSTLLKLIQGALAPTSGAVTINGTPADAYAGADRIATVVSVLNQSPHLFDTTVANNIRLGRYDASEEELRQAARQARLDGLIESLPEGYLTPMHEAGQRFSGGERQRVALARILLQQTPVVLLDEPTVGLDPRTERELLATMFDAMADKSLIWITHHLVGVEQMDEVIFMEEGRIIMRGTHEQLMKQEARYRRLYQLDRPLVMKAVGLS